MLFLFLMYFTELKAELSVVRTCGYRAFLIYLTYFSNIPLCPILGSTELGGEGFLSWGRVGFNLSHTSHGSVALSMWDLPKVLPYMYRVPYTACCGHPCRSRNWGLWRQDWLCSVLSPGFPLRPGLSPAAGRGRNCCSKLIVIFWSFWWFFFPNFKLCHHDWLFTYVQADAVHGDTDLVKSARVPSTPSLFSLGQQRPGLLQLRWSMLAMGYCR